MPINPNVSVEKSLSSSSSTSISASRVKKTPTATNFIAKNKLNLSGNKQSKNSNNNKLRPSSASNSSNIAIKCLNDENSIALKVVHNNYQTTQNPEHEFEEQVAEISIISSRSSIVPPPPNGHGDDDDDDNNELVRTSENCEKLRAELFKSEGGNEAAIETTQTTLLNQSSPKLVQGDKFEAELDEYVNSNSGAGFGQNLARLNNRNTNSDVNILKFDEEKSKIRSQFMRR
jgi:hypothetical protein